MRLAAGNQLGRAAVSRVPGILAGTAWLALGFALPIQAQVTIRGRIEAPEFPAGTDAIPFELRRDLIYFRATLRSPSGRDTTGLLILDTGAPTLSLTRGVLTYLRLDTLELLSMSRAIQKRRPVVLELGRRTQLNDLEALAELPDTLLGSDVLGLFAPDLIPDKGILLDYRRRRWAIVPRGTAIVHRDSTRDGSGVDLGQRARVQQSRSAFASVLGPGAIPVPVRVREGGRILVRAHLEDPRVGWRSSPLTLLVDTGSSSCAVFEDVLDRQGLQTRRWPWLRDVSVYTVKGRFAADLALVPRMSLGEVASPLGIDRVEASAAPRQALHDLEDELGMPVHGLLGQTFLSRFRVLLDAMQGVLWLEAVEDTTSRRFRNSHLGIQLEHRWGRLRVAAVARDSPADRAGIAIGDILVSVGGATVGTAQPEQVEELLRGPPGTDVVLVVRRDGEERVLKLTREQLL